MGVILRFWLQCLNSTTVSDCLTLQEQSNNPTSGLASDGISR